VNLLTIPRPLLARLLRQLARQTVPAVTCPVGSIDRPGRCEFLVRPPDGDAGPRLLLRLGENLDRPDRLPPNCIAWLTIGRGRGHGRAAGGLSDGTAIDELRLVGPGMHQVALAADSAGLDRNNNALERWSRTAGALGLGVLPRLVALTYGLIGAGRTGSVLAEQLTGLGVQRTVLIDPDRLEESNLGEMTGLTEKDVGRPKAEALARHLSRRGMVEALAQSITNVRALRAVEECDVLFCGVDHDAARLAVSALSVLFLRPLIDVGVGIHGAGATREMGADIRLLLPGEGCLLCVGGLSDEAGARAALRSADSELGASAGQDWRRQRAGSLRSLNELAASLAVRMWEDLVAERLSTGTWLHLEFDDAGRLSVVYPSPPRSACSLCRLSGRGEVGLSAATEVFRDPAS